MKHGIFWIGPSRSRGQLRDGRFLIKHVEMRLGREAHSHRREAHSLRADGPPESRPPPRSPPKSATTSTHQKEHRQTVLMLQGLESTFDIG